jgi:IclR family transcriptional regulator, KDG regulon repressor
MNTISKAIDILELFLINKNGISFSDIIKESRLKRTTVYNIVSYLVKRGFIKQRIKRGKYYLGVRFLDIAGVINNDKSDESAISYLLELSKLVNESVYLKVWYGSDLLLSSAHDYYDDLSLANPSDWATLPLHCTCLGKLILSSMSNKDLNKYFYNTTLEKRTSNTIIDIKQLKAQLAIIRREGIAFEYEENTLGVNGVAVGIKNGEGETIGSVFVFGSSRRLNNIKLKKIEPSIRACSLKISKTLIVNNIENTKMKAIFNEGVSNG